ncbi:uncharacterized protein M421DRAFT_274187 [Didymella exigua CBS 183.55]|uniref:Uncharacterized protein n=1 Tax=Didymella exigua CBS 183.55 TaxID=1150837 RepID=A0A6A5RAW2_9PLEO|nr:uncharacterized protein M421DRAFT_274187 [Didymella exigua CBS 183.55]KAF1924683.1 hypothetical protein M421DRAFT_274187 [Didymella exigua CBS 183.55]
MSSASQVQSGCRHEAHLESSSVKLQTWARLGIQGRFRPHKAKHARHIWSKITGRFETSTRSCLQQGSHFPRLLNSTPRASQGTRHTRLATGRRGQIPCLVGMMCALTGRTGVLVTSEKSLSGWSRTRAHTSAKVVPLADACVSWLHRHVHDNQCGKPAVQSSVRSASRRRKHLRRRLYEVNTPF